MPLNGHCTYLPGGKWILNDAYPQETECLQDLFYHVVTGTRHNLGQLAAVLGFDGELRCDLHPRSSRDGRKVMIDSSHVGAECQMYLLDISAVVG